MGEPQDNNKPFRPGNQTNPTSLFADSLLKRQEESINLSHIADLHAGNPATMSC
jgi:hypothetical protein